MTDPISYPCWRLLAFGFTPEQARALADAGYTVFFVPASAVGL